MGLSAFRARIDADYARSLTALIESQIIPRMMVAHSGATTSCTAVIADDVIGADEIAAFAPLVMQIEADELFAVVEAILARGVPMESVLVDLLAPTARMLGEFWENDTCDFMDVTMGLWRLQEVVHEITGGMTTGQTSADGGRRALFCPVPGDQHSLGTVMIDDIFRRDGWMTDRLCDPQTPELLKRAQAQWFDIIGLTVSCDCHIGPLRAIIAALRNISKNPHVGIMVGGRVFSANPELAVQVGADGTAVDAKSAPRVADQLVRERERAVAT
ncbi:cobalamin B12-binding domain-containing protein [Novosphingobium acidiphilum]|uniref:cobalamin B12-binding domain-containing protein n=1 Tax=Novosphingobium acidiphilum TaxID=505248 RepID=UPI001FDEDB31|nr:cobalamin-dependent protein [Novosphingobium acidiphilum]